MKKLPVIGLLTLLWSGLHSQEIWSLSACIQHALENNVGLQQAKIAVDLAGITVKENRHKMLPDFNGNLNSGISFGRNIDPTTNGFTTEDILYSNYSLSSGVTLFQGGLIRNTIRQSQLNQKAAREDYIQAGNDLALAIATYYLQVLMAQEQVETAKKNLEISNQQLVQIGKLIGVGAKPEADALEIKAQQAVMEQTLVGAENALDLAWLTLKQSLRLDPERDLRLERLEESRLDAFPLESYEYKELSGAAREHQAGLQAARTRLEAARIGEKMARALYYPSLFLSASVGSRFSDAAIRPNAFDTTRVPLPGFYINGLPLDIEQDLIGIRSTEVIPFKTQFDQFLGYGAGLSLSIPIYNNYSVKANRQRAKWTTRQSELQLELEEERLSQNIIQAMANFKASRKAYEAAVKAHQASAFAHEKTQKRFELGTANTFELNQSMTQLLNAESSRLVAKYDMVFKQKVLDYYAGKKIEL